MASTQEFEYQPRIQPVMAGPRSFFSVMVPAYNDGHYLEQTLNSVLAQDPGPEEMQIEVIDDHSSKEDLKAVVDRVGNGRVEYWRQPKNVGPTQNFNTCIQRSRGTWVHILHGDDLVQPGFYETIGNAIRSNGEAGSVFCRNVVINESGQWVALSPIEQRDQGIIHEWSVTIAKSQRTEFCSMVVKRSVYEAVGGFDIRLIHTADWDMWKRVALEAPVWYVPELLACYRVHSGSHTSSLFRAGLNVADTRLAIAISESYYPADLQRAVTKEARKYACKKALSSANHFLENGDWSGGFNQLREALAALPATVTCLRAAKILLSSLAMLFKRQGATG